MSGFAPIGAAAAGDRLIAAIEAAAASSAAPNFYEELRDGFAKEIVADFNTGAVVLLKPAQLADSGDPLNPFSGAGPALRTPRNAIVLGFADRDIDGQKIMAGDRRVLFDAADFNDANLPATNDSVEIDGRVHAVLSMIAVPAAGSAVIYILQARTAGPA